MADFLKCFNRVIDIEGGYKLHNVSGDRGGMTYAGIARKKWPEWEGWPKIDAGEFDDELKNMVQLFFKKKFWDIFFGDMIGSERVAYVLYSFGINIGRVVTVKIVQKIVGETIDGLFGPKTFKSLNGYIQRRGVDVFIPTLGLEVVFRYKDICTRDRRREHDSIESNLKFLCGWINRVQDGIK